ncbi:MAG: hypothetical protein JSU66_13835 [Deltaproteobacteria bacterium]|nr:MAG: hypothetical protein JSU66_13835 [Deltaproteobacteria bacterium]
MSFARTPQRRAGRTARRARGVLLGLIGVLYLVSIPWYRPTGAVPSMVLGLPDWVFVALVCYVLIAVLNAIAWLLTDVSDPEPGESEREP